MIPEFVDSEVTPDWIRQQLARLRRQLRFAMVADRLLPVALAAVALVVGTLCVDRLLDLSKGMRWVLLLAGLGWLGWLLRNGVWRVMRMDLTDLDLARAIERLQPGLGEAALAALEFGENPGSAARRLALRARCRQLADLRIGRVVNRERARRCLGGIAAVAASGVMAFWGAPDTMGIWSRRWLPPGDAAWPMKTSLYLPAARSGKLYVPAGEMVPVEIGLVPDYEAPKAVRAVLAEGRKTLWEGSCELAGPGQWMTHFRAPAGSAVLTIEGGDFRTEIEVIPVVRPRVGSVIVRGSHPQYDAPQVFDDAESLGNASLLPESEVAVELRVIGDVGSLQLADADGGELTVTRGEDGVFSANWTHVVARSLVVNSKAVGADVAGVPFAFAVGLQRDAPPEVTAAVAKSSRLVTTRGPQVGRRVTPDARIPLTIQASDDFGLANVALELKVELPDGAAQMNRRVLTETTEAKVADWQQSLQLDLVDMELPVDSRILVTGASLDQRAGEGVVGRSGTLVFEVVPSDALYRDLVRRMQGQRARLRQVLERAEKRRDELAAETETPPSSKQVADWVRDHQQDVQRVRNSREAVARVLGEAYWNNVGSADVRELLRKTVIDAMDRLTGPLFAENGKALSLLAGSPDKKLDAAATQEMVVIELQDLLSAMGQWESFADVVRQLDEIITLQRDVRDGAETIRKSDTDSLFDD
jgi:hypothetical protein